MDIRTVLCFIYNKVKPVHVSGYMYNVFFNKTILAPVRLKGRLYGLLLAVFLIHLQYI